MVEQSGVFLASERQPAAWEPRGTTTMRAAAPLQQHGLSIVVPTRNEAGNIAALVDRLEQTLPDISLEILFVDDSDDETVAAIETVRKQARSNIILIHRPAGQRNGGLGSAVVAGLRVASAAWVCVMDA